MSDNTLGSFTTLSAAVVPELGYAWLTLRRPNSSNAVNDDMLAELPAALERCDRDKRVRAVVLCGEGKNFCAGLDLSTLSHIHRSLAQEGACPAETRSEFRRRILRMQAAVTALEQCRWPVIAAIHGACVGAGIDIATACDIRLCTADAHFCVKEVDLAVTADMGTLQRLPALVGEGRARELALTARTFSGEQALQYGLVTSCHATRELCVDAAAALARSLAAKPALAVVGTKAVMLQGRGRAVHEGLEYVALWNSAFLLSHELDEVFERMGRRRGVAAKL